MRPEASLLDTHLISSDDILAIFKKALALRECGKRYGHFYEPGSKPSSKVVGCLFFEPSTRTRMSFQTAAYRLGHQVLTMELSTGSSLSKGESYLDTVLNVVAMGPDILVVRYGESAELDEALPKLSVPVINAGSGQTAHPTQALLDAFTIQQNLGSVRDKKVLIVGDIQHSRVAKSNFEVLSKLGARIGIAGPTELLPGADSLKAHGIQIFENIDDGIAWADVYMGLRIQLERHTSTDLKKSAVSDFHAQFGLNHARLKILKKDSIILHPGPINHGVEFAPEVMNDERCRVLEQVSNGVLVRAALLELR
ncbi:MAG: aspartate carbamoyltransferase catalytic subunit [Bdellovibrionota bacterium]